MNQPARPSLAVAAQADVDAWFTPLRVGMGLALALAALFPDIVLGTGSFYFKDYGVLGYPVIQHHHDRFWSGDFIPFWNAHSNCGAPFMAQWGTMALYPFSLFHLLFPLPWSLGMFCLIHLWFGGMGMRRLAAEHLGAGLPATIAATVFVFNGFTLSCLQWPNYTVALGWLPWMALAVQRACRQGGRSIVLAALAGTMQMLSGVPEFIVLSWLFIFALLVVDALKLTEFAARLKIVKRCAGVVLLITGLAAIQLLPFFELLSLSQRHAHFTSEKWAMPWHGIANFLTPLFHYAKTYTGDFFQQNQSLLASYYPGLAALSLAVWGAFRSRKTQVRALALIAFASVVLAMGENGFLYLALKKLAPQLGFVRYPVKFLALFAGCLPLLAAAGFGWFRERAASNPGSTARNLTVWVAGIVILMLLTCWFMQAFPSIYDQPGATFRNAAVRAAFLAAFLVLLFRAQQCDNGRRCLRLSLVALAIIVLDVATHLPHWNPRIAAREFTPGIARAAHEFSADEARIGVSRVMISPAAERVFLISTVTNATMDFQGKRLAFWSNLNLLDDVPKLNGSSTLQLREQDRIQKLIYGTNQFNAAGLADFLAVSHETSSRMATQWQPRETASPWITAGRTARFVTPENAFALIESEEVDLRTEVLLSTAESSVTNNAYGIPASIEIERFEPDSIEFRTNAKEPALIVLAQTYHPGWHAHANGIPIPVWRANHAFQAVPVPAGSALITLEYRDQAFVPGLVLSLLTAIICSWLWIRYEKRPQSVPDRDRPAADSGEINLRQA